MDFMLSQQETDRAYNPEHQKNKKDDIFYDSKKCVILWLITEVWRPEQDGTQKLWRARVWEIHHLYGGR